MVGDGNVQNPCTGHHAVAGHKENINERSGVTGDSGRYRDGLEQVTRLNELEEEVLQRVTSFRHQVYVHITTNHNMILA